MDIITHLNQQTANTIEHCMALIQLKGSATPSIASYNDARFAGTKSYDMQYCTVKIGGTTSDQYVYIIFKTNVYCNGVAKNSGDSVSWAYGNTGWINYIIVAR